jgi:bile acid:Na+ symporter, BASS family
MEAFLQTALAFIVPLYAVVSMFGAGLGRSLREVTRPLRRPAFLAAALFANFIVAPAIAYGIARLLRLDRPYAIGLFLLSTAAGAPFLVALVRSARSDLSLATGTLVALMVATMIYMPLVLPAVLPWAEIGALAIAKPLLLTMLLPLVLGLVLHARAPRVSERIQPWFVKGSMAALVLLMSVTLVQNLPAIGDMIGSGALASAFLFTFAAFLTGYTLGGRNATHRSVLGLATGQRAVAAAIVTASQAFDGPGPLVMVVVSSLVAFLVLFPAAYLLRRGGAKRAARVRFTSPGAKSGGWLPDR